MVNLHPRTLYEMILERSEKTPDALAILSPDKDPITYQQLALQVTLIALQLNRLGFQRGDRIAIVLPNGPESATAYLAISSVCTCAPLNPTFMVEEFIFSLTDIHTKAIVIQSGILPLAREAAHQLGIPVLDLEPDLIMAGFFKLVSDLSEKIDTQRPEFADIDDIALVLHTSGTTSRPKIVPITHRNIYHTVNNSGNALSLTTADRCLNIMPLFNIHGLVSVTLASIAAGASIVCTPGFISYQVMDWFSSMAPTWYSAVPSLHQAIVDQARLQPEKTKVANLRFIRSASSPLSEQLARDLESVFDAKVREALGITEATGAITLIQLPPPPGKKGSVGVPQGTAKMCSMDETGNVLPVNMTGELCVGGENVVNGYENNPEASAATFVNSWMRTGDLGYIDEDGYVFITGRVKEIINRGGAKVSPHEVDRVLLSHPAVKQASAFAVPHPTLGEDVAAAVVLREGCTASMQELRQFAAANLADFKVPRQIVIVKEIPKSAAGKIQRIGLAEKLKPELDALRVRETSSGWGLLNEVEAGIQSIWQEILGMEHIGLHDDYLVMGGDSIRASILLMNVNERFGTNLLISDIFNTPTVATMAGVVQANLEKGSTTSLFLPQIQRRSQRDTLLSPAQSSLWLIQQIDPATVAYNISFVFKLTGGLNRKSLELALNELVLRQASLRTTYQYRDGKPFQLVLPFEPFELHVEDYSNLDKDEYQHIIQTYVAEHGNLPFDLEREISGRYALLQRGPNENYLYVCIHHINWDAWSRFVFISELMQLYSALRSGVKPNLPELPIQYTDYALALDEWLQSETRSAFLDHWMKNLSDELPSLELPTDRPRLAQQTDHGDRYHFNFSPALSNQIKEFCRKERIMPFHLLLSVYVELLRRYSGQEDIIIGCPFANRPRPEQHGLIGLFVNVLPIRINLAGNLSVRELLKQVNSVILDAMTWQAIPFEVLVKEIAPERNLSRSPIYQVAINMLNVPHRDISIPGLEISEVLLEKLPAQFELTFEFAEEGKIFCASANFNTDLFDSSTIIRMASHFQNILREMLIKPENLISDLQIHSTVENQQIILEWNNTRREYPNYKNVCRLFEEQVKKTPDSLAVVYGRGKASFSELNQQANRLARRLNHLGAKKGSFVGIYMERSLEMVVAMLAILKIGGAYVPLDLTYPRERLEFMVEDSGIDVIVSQGNWASTLPGKHNSEIKTILLDSQDSEVAFQSSENLSIDIEATTIAYIIYTSGSTGYPKGICIPHRAINRLVLNTDYLTISSEDRIAQASNMSFDAATFEIWGALLNGACLVGIPQEILLSPKVLGQMIHEQKISILFLTTALFNQVASVAPGVFGPLRNMLFGGEAVTPGWVRAVLKSGAPPQRLLHVYGPTETTTFATWHLVQDVDVDDVNVPIGMPISNTTAYVLDERLQPVPIGVTGELYIGGDGLAAGYHNRPELTEERFVHNPFKQEEQKKCISNSDHLYKTGDLVRRNPNGNIVYQGRLDGQVKLRGFRIELTEIEAILIQNPSIQDAIVMMREDQPGNKQLVGYIIPIVEESLDQFQIQGYLKEKLPGYMVPSAFVFMEAFPLTPNGKVERNALPPPRLDELESHNFVPTKTPVENKLAQIWMEVLGISRVGALDNFFNLGGNSLLAVQVMVRIQSEMGAMMPYYKIFESSNLLELAMQVDLDLRQRKYDSRRKEVSEDREEFVI
jgi:amino acid adenylation domain-containing protein